MKKRARKQPAPETTAPVKPKKTVAILRTCGPKGESHGGFVWPLTPGAKVEAPDWSPEPKCGNGLHGLLNGEGDWGLLNWAADAVAVIFDADADHVIDIGGKVKVPAGVVRLVGTLPKLLCSLVCDAARIKAWVQEVIAASKTDDSKLAASGEGSQLAASGNGSKLAASGEGSQLAASGYGSQLAASGDGSKLAASGYGSIVMAASLDCFASAGENGVIALGWHDGRRPRIAVGYVGEDGIEAGVPYYVRDGKLVKASL